MTNNKSLITAVLAVLVVSSAFAQSSVYKNVPQTKTTQKTSTTTPKPIQKTPRESHWMSVVDKPVNKGVIEITSGKRNYTVMTDKVSITMLKKPFEAYKLTKGSLIKVYGNMQGSTITATKIEVDRVGPAKPHKPIQHANPKNKDNKNTANTKVIGH